MRMLSLLLSLVLVVGLIQFNAPTASATTTYSFIHAYDCQRTPPFPKKNESFTAYDLKTPLGASGNHIGGDLQATYNWTLTSLGPYSGISSPSSYLRSIVASVASAYSTATSSVAADDVGVFQLKKDGSHIAYGVIFAQSSELTVFLGDNWDSLGSTYLLSNSALSGTTTVTISRDLTTGFEPPAPAPSHTHVWTPDTTGLDTKKAVTTIRCTASGCDLSDPLTVSLTASDVTLPGDVFTAKITTENAVTKTTFPLTVSETPGYKYSPDGSGFTEIEASSFTPKQGIYQASILVKDGDTEVENLYVTYTVSDPAVTAATGDNRPIELMLVGLAAFTTMAAVAFILDSRRRARF